MRLFLMTENTSLLHALKYLEVMDIGDEIVLSTHEIELKAKRHDKGWSYVLYDQNTYKTIRSSEMCCMDNKKEIVHLIMKHF